MTLHAPKGKHPNPGSKTPESRRPRTRKNAPPLTLGHVLGDAWAAKQRADARAAELADMGFKPLGGA